VGSKALKAQSSNGPSPPPHSPTDAHWIPKKGFIHFRGLRAPNTSPTASLQHRLCTVVPRTGGLAASPAAATREILASNALLHRSSGTCVSNSSGKGWLWSAPPGSTRRGLFVIELLIPHGLAALAAITDGKPVNRIRMLPAVTQTSCQTTQSQLSEKSLVMCQAARHHLDQPILPAEVSRSPRGHPSIRKAAE
jgi:hypothetical protein